MLVLGNHGGYEGGNLCRGRRFQNSAFERRRLRYLGARRNSGEVVARCAPLSIPHPPSKSRRHRRTWPRHEPNNVFLQQLVWD